MDSDCLDTLVSREGPAAPAWFTRLHRELERRFAGEYVFRFAGDLKLLVRWLEETAVEREASLLSHIGFDDDRDGPRVEPDGGFLEFWWEDRRYRAVSVRVPGPRYDGTHTWVACSDRTAGERLVDVVARHAQGRRSRVMVLEEGDWEEAPRLEASLARYGWDAVVLPETMRDRLRRAVEQFFQSEELYRSLEIPWKLGLLLVGPPGTGKTLTVKVLASTCGVPFLYVRGLNGFCERRPTPEAVHEVFQGARKRGPCLLCLEDVDSLVTEDLRSAFLNELDGLEEDCRGILTVATTNPPPVLILEGPAAIFVFNGEANVGICYIATIRPAEGPLQGRTVEFATDEIGGTGSVQTDEAGQAQFCFTVNTDVDPMGQLRTVTAHFVGEDVRVSNSYLVRAAAGFCDLLCLPFTGLAINPSGASGLRPAAAGFCLEHPFLLDLLLCAEPTDKPLSHSPHRVGTPG